MKPPKAAPTEVRLALVPLLSDIMQKRAIAVVIVAVLAIVVDTGWSQLSQFTGKAAGPFQNQAPRSYTDFYSQHIREYKKPPVNVHDYMIDKYYYHNPSISPYLNLARRPSTDGLNNYHRYVRPELERRAASTSTPVGTGKSFSDRQFNSNPYFNQIYNRPPLK